MNETMKQPEQNEPEDEVIKGMEQFIDKNPLYFICSILYYILASFLLGGRWYSFVIALLFYVISMGVVFSPLGEKILRLLEHVRRLETKREKEYLIPIFNEVYEQAIQKNPELEKIEICVIDTMTVNALALGKHTVAVTKGAMNTFSEDELKSLIAHEFGHIVNLDTIAKLYTMVGNGIFMFLILGTRACMFVMDFIHAVMDKSGIGRFVMLLTRLILDAIVFIFSFLMQAVLAINSRSSEYRADRYAHQLGYGEELVEALYLLEKMQLGDNSTIIQKMTASHPRITARIEKLETLIDKA